MNDMIYKKIFEIFHKNFEKNVNFGEVIKLHTNNAKLKKFLSCLPSFNNILRVVNKISFVDEKNKYVIINL